MGLMAASTGSPVDFFGAGSTEGGGLSSGLSCFFAGNGGPFAVGLLKIAANFACRRLSSVTTSDFVSSASHLT
jgi:hypothetical protein